MGTEQIEATDLWKESLASRTDDPTFKYRDRLRIALLNMRENVIPFVRNIHRDVLGLTVHDESHLDALWQTASCIAGDKFILNPIEAFVFGASALLHDAGLAVAAYPGGLVELSETTVWRDAEAGARARRNPQSNDPLPENERNEILFTTLRKLHAEQAQNLISFTFKRPNREEAIPLLQDISLHDSLKAAIGRIAHSHHWNSADLINRLVTHAGTVPGFPPEWTLNEVKVACLLRCADASHLDSLRAPTMLFSLSHISGNSINHWTFQNKLNSITRSKDKIVYYAGKPFGVDEASSWWLAYDTMKMVDEEIKNSNSILEEIGSEQFSATGVFGIETPRSLSKTVRVEGWTPISAEVRVSDPVHLARTLGGRNLYGEGAIAPVRELLQNAVDAVRARRAHQQRGDDWGKIRLIVEATGTENSPEIWLHVDDTGTGMSERVVTGPLIDFGKSFWSSPLVDEEFPGLRSRGTKLVGKFGIGFFSVFLLGDAVRVITRRFDESEASASVLSFDELTRRPILRRAATGELPLDYSTRVSVKLSERSRSLISSSLVNRFRSNHRVSFVDRVVNLIAAVDVDIEIIDRVNGDSRKHVGQWLESPAEEFLREVCSFEKETLKNRIIANHSERVRPIVEPTGAVVGRAALLVDSSRESSTCMISVGGFSVRGSEINQYRFRPFEDEAEFNDPLGGAGLVGVIFGETQDAARARASASASREAIALWAKEQDDLIEAARFTPTDQVEICHSLIKLGAESVHLPFGFLGGRFATFAEFRHSIQHANFIDIPLTHEEYRNTFNYRTISGLTTPYFTSSLHSTVAVVSMSPGSDFLQEEVRREIVESGGMKLGQSSIESMVNEFSAYHLRKIAISAWDVDPEFSIIRVSLIAGNALAGSLESWVLRLSKPK